MNEMNLNKVKLRLLMLYEFQMGTKPMITTKNICSVYGEHAVSDSTVRKWYSRFRVENFNIEDELRTGRPSHIDTQKIIDEIENNPHITLREISHIFHIAKSTVFTQMRDLGFTTYYGNWIPHTMHTENLMERVEFCTTLYNRYCDEPDGFLHRIVTGSKKWIHLNENIKNNSSKTTIPSLKLSSTISSAASGTSISDGNASSSNNSRKILFSIWWDYQGIIYYELVLEEDFNDNTYCNQLENVQKAIATERPELLQNNENQFVFHYDKSPLNVPNDSVLQQLFIDFNWMDTIRHPLNSPDLSPSDFYLFRHLHNFLMAKSIRKRIDLEFYLQQFFLTKSLSFFKDGIDALPNRWKDVIEKKGHYINE